MKVLRRYRKGNQRIIMVVGLMVLVLMFIVLWYTAMQDWLVGTGDELIKKLPAG